MLKFVKMLFGEEKTTTQKRHKKDGMPTCRN
jgi:hypothetical protein